MHIDAPPNQPSPSPDIPTCSPSPSSSAHSITISITHHILHGSPPHDRTYLPPLPPLPPSDVRIYVLNFLPSGGPFVGRSSPPSDGGGPASYPEVAHSFEPRPTPPLPRCPSNLHCTNAIPCIAHVYVLMLTAQLQQDTAEVVVQASPSSFRLLISPCCQLSEVCGFWGVSRTVGARGREQES